MEIKSLTSWRGVCALCVALFHFPIAGPVREFPLVANAYLFVDFFFVLSGYVIAAAWEDRLAAGDQTWGFLLRRFGRLWPLHATVLILFVSVSLVQGDFNATERHSAVAVLTNLALVHALGIHHGLTWNGPSWSISVEAFMYLLFALLAPLPRRAYVYVALVVLGLSVLEFWSPHGMASTFDYGAYRGLAGFFTGALLTRLPRIDVGSLGEIAVTALAAVFVMVGRGSIAAPAVFALVVYVFAGSRGAVSRAIEAAPFYRLGEWSYSTYMLHSLAVAAIWMAAGALHLGRHGPHLTAPMWEGYAIAAAYVAGTVAAAAVTYRVIEMPARAYFAGLASRRLAAA